MYFLFGLNAQMRHHTPQILSFLSAKGYFYPLLNAHCYKWEKVVISPPPPQVVVGFFVWGFFCFGWFVCFSLLEAKPKQILTCSHRHDVVF